MVPPIFQASDAFIQMIFNSMETLLFNQCLINYWWHLIDLHLRRWLHINLNKYLTFFPSLYGEDIPNKETGREVKMVGL